MSSNPIHIYQQFLFGFIHISFKVLLVQWAGQDQPRFFAVPSSGLHLFAFNQPTAISMYFLYVPATFVSIQHRVYNF
jgi:hypothetical protein